MSEYSVLSIGKLGDERRQLSVAHRRGLELFADPVQVRVRTRRAASNYARSSAEKDRADHSGSRQAGTELVHDADLRSHRGRNGAGNHPDAVGLSGLPHVTLRNLELSRKLRDEIRVTAPTERLRKLSNVTEQPATLLIMAIAKLD